MPDYVRNTNGPNPNVAEPDHSSTSGTFDPYPLYSTQIDAESARAQASEAVRLRFDAPQVLSANQQLQALSNIGLGASSTANSPAFDPAGTNTATLSSGLQARRAAAAHDAHLVYGDAAIGRMTHLVSDWQRWALRAGAIGAAITEWSTPTVVGDVSGGYAMTLAEATKWLAFDEAFMKVCDAAGVWTCAYAGGDNSLSYWSEQTTFYASGGVGQPIDTEGSVAGTIKRHPGIAGAGGFHRGVHVVGSEQGRSQASSSWPYLAARGVTIVRRPVYFLPTNGNAILDSLNNTTSAMTALLTDIRNAFTAGIYSIISCFDPGIENALSQSDWIAKWIAVSRATRNVSGTIALSICSEPHAGTQQNYYTASQAIVTALRQDGENRTILVPGWDYSKLYNWLPSFGGVNDNPTGWITDPSSNFMYEAHYYPHQEHAVPSYGFYDRYSITKQAAVLANFLGTDDPHPQYAIGTPTQDPVIGTYASNVDPYSISGLVTAFEAERYAGRGSKNYATNSSFLDTSPVNGPALKVNVQSSLCATGWPTTIAGKRIPSLTFVGSSSGGLRLDFTSAMTTWTVVLGIMAAAVLVEGDMVSFVDGSASTYGISNKPGNAGYYHDGSFVNASSGPMSSNSAQGQPLVVTAACDGSAVTVRINGTDPGFGSRSNHQLSTLLIGSQANNTYAVTSLFVYNVALGTANKQLVERWVSAASGLAAVS